jgi:acetate kinase
MGTRSGDTDPAVLLHLMNSLGPFMIKAICKPSVMLHYNRAAVT